MVIGSHHFRTDIEQDQLSMTSLANRIAIIGAGQAGLSSSYHLRRLGIPHLVLDADDAPGGAWQHRWDALTMQDVHGVAELPGSVPPPR